MIEPASPCATQSQNMLTGLPTARSLYRLEQISQLRARGIGNHIPLPQLVVCGDQSAGKSSVLEGLTQIPFPRRDGMCTTFPTEIILQHYPEELKVDATIIASKLRTNDEKAILDRFHVQLPGYQDLPNVIQEAGRLMGLRDPGSPDSGPAFVEDVLRVEVRGRVGLHLSVVDLPGLISVPNEEQSEDDVQTVYRIVDEYIADPRTIILAVVQAGNDIANQPIIQKARKVDPDGVRTVGIITKPDLINEGSEKRIALLASNKDTTKLKLGFFLVKNPTPNELSKGITPEERYKSEKHYFRSSPWKEQELHPDKTGIQALQTFLQHLLDRHIEKEIPKVRDEVRALHQKTVAKLARLGEERSDYVRMRTYLTRIAMDFHQLTISALSGTYDDVGGSSFYHQKHRATRLRAVIQISNTTFANDMRSSGQKRKTSVLDLDFWEELANDEPSEDTKASRKKLKAWVKDIYNSCRGKELPGTYNYVLLAELFREQASPWLGIAENHLQTVVAAAQEFVLAALRHVIQDDLVFEEVKELISFRLSVQEGEAKAELDKLWQDEQHQPITYNHYFTDNIQKSRDQAMKSQLKRAVNMTKEQDWNGKMHISNSSLDANRLINGLQQRINVNMDDQACEEALSGLNAYYKVALKTFVDNVCRQVLERHLLRGLSEIFSPSVVAAMPDEELARIAGESPKLTEERKTLQNLRDNLDISLRELRASGTLTGLGNDASP